jgi:hypothetical protein
LANSCQTFAIGKWQTFGKCQTTNGNRVALEKLFINKHLRNKTQQEWTLSTTVCPATLHFMNLNVKEHDHIIDDGRGGLLAQQQDRVGGGISAVARRHQQHDNIKQQPAARGHVPLPEYISPSAITAPRQQISTTDSCVPPSTTSPLTRISWQLWWVKLRLEGRGGFRLVDDDDDRRPDGIWRCLSFADRARYDVLLLGLTNDGVVWEGGGGGNAGRPAGTQHVKWWRYPTIKTYDDNKGGYLFDSGRREQWRLRWYITVNFLFHSMMTTMDDADYDDDTEGWWWWRYDDDEVKLYRIA